MFLARDVKFPKKEAADKYIKTKHPGHTSYTSSPLSFIYVHLFVSIIGMNMSTWCCLILGGIYKKCCSADIINLPEELVGNRRAGAHSN